MKCPVCGETHPTPYHDPLARRTISPKELRLRGWEPANLPGHDNPRDTLARRNYNHRDGWTIRHCNHPTANWPYILRNPAGMMILTGAAFGEPPDFGRAWPTVASAVDYVATQTKEAL